jgi:hypothetical protein
LAHARATGKFSPYGSVLLLSGCTVGFPVTSGQNLLFAAGAALVANGATGFAGALAGTLAFSATAIGKRLAQAGFGNGFDMLHKG